MAFYSQTRRLSDIMMQITAKQMQDIVHKQKMQDERFVSQDQPKNNLFKNIVVSKIKENKNQRRLNTEKLK